MILEIASVDIQSDKHDEFEVAIKRAVDTVLIKAKGFISFELQHGIEKAERITLLIRWETLDDHMVAFRQSDQYTRWREIIEPYFASTPQVDHWRQIFTA
jgi:heme-degrading monooxygenase HmoA